VEVQERSAFLPAYYRLAEDLRAKIERGEFKPGDMIPSTAQLARQYGVSPMTVRQGLALLAKDGYIKTVQGKGSFITVPPIDTLVLRFVDNSLLGEDRNIKVKLLNLNIVAADSGVAEKLGVEIGAKIIKIKRVLSGDEGPIAVDSRFLPYLKGVPLLEKEIAYAAFPEVVARHTDVFLAKSSLEISACALSPEEAELLEVPAGSPGLLLEQIIYSNNNRAIGWSKMICRGDRLVLRATSHPR